MFLCIHIHAPPVWPMPTPAHIHAYTCVCGQIGRSCEHGERVSAHDTHHVRHKPLHLLMFLCDANCYVISCHAFRSCNQANSGSDAKNALPMHILCSHNTYPYGVGWQCPTLVSQPRVCTREFHTRTSVSKIPAVTRETAGAEDGVMRGKAKLLVTLTLSFFLRFIVRHISPL